MYFLFVVIAARYIYIDIYSTYIASRSKKSKDVDAENKISIVGVARTLQTKTGKRKAMCF